MEDMRPSLITICYLALPYISSSCTSPLLEHNDGWTTPELMEGFNEFMRCADISLDTFQSCFDEYLKINFPYMKSEFKKYAGEIFDVMMWSLFSRLLRESNDFTPTNILPLDEKSKIMSYLYCFSGTQNRSISLTVISQLIWEITLVFFIYGRDLTDMPVNALRFFNEISPHGHIRLLDLSYSYVSGHQYRFEGSGLTNLVKLSLCHSGLRKIPHITGLDKLRSLDLANNGITTIEFHCHDWMMGSVETIDLKGNKTGNGSPSNACLAMINRMREIFPKLAYVDIGEITPENSELYKLLKKEFTQY